MENPNFVSALVYYTVSSFLDPVQWLICGVSGWKMDRIDHAVLAGMATVAILFTILAFLYPGGTLFSYPSPHVGVAILGKTVGAGLMTALIHWLKQRQLGRQAQR